jgi:hypothetical protein
VTDQDEQLTLDQLLAELLETIEVETTSFGEWVRGLPLDPFAEGV